MGPPPYVSGYEWLKDFLKICAGVERSAKPATIKCQSCLMARPIEEVIPTRPSLLGRIKDWADDESWRDFCNVYRGLIFGFAVKHGLSEGEAEDVVQDTLVSVAKSIRDFRYDPNLCSFKTWLMNLTRRRIVDHIRRGSTEVRGQAYVGADDHAAFLETIVDPNRPDLERIWDEEWEKSLIEAALEKLKAQVDARQFEIFFLHVIKQQPPAQVARTLGVTVARVYLVKHRLKGAFEKALAGLKKQWG